MVQSILDQDEHVHTIAVHTIAAAWGPPHAAPPPKFTLFGLITFILNF